MVAGEEIDRSETELVVLEDAPSWREFHERALRRAGFRQVSAYPTEPSHLADHLNHGRVRRADLVVYGVQEDGDACWEHLEKVRGFYQGPMLATAESHCDKLRNRALGMGAHDFLALDQFGEEGLELKVETVLAAHRIHSMVEENDHRNQRLFVNILTVMVKILESKDPYTRFHSHSVALWSRMLGRKKGLGEEELIRLGLSAVFHDFGKIGIPEEILNKPSRLTDEEFEIMKQHPLIGRDLLSSLDLLSDLLPGITHHHERWDGRGYPDGLKDETIPLWGRIICLADAYDTMASQRTYKAPMPQEKIIDELKKGRGTQFDPELVDFMLEILAEKDAEAAGGGGGGIDERPTAHMNGIK